ncbi:hypothetical protein ABDK96_00245 [Citricoccus nitrophenolicus]|uniref:Uncharacterized protein n=1 Tax=Citricoccus nitrophenolicus TaxID=863575 RepID=A0ABV0IEL4_9MICC
MKSAAARPIPAPGTLTITTFNVLHAEQDRTGRSGLGMLHGPALALEEAGTLPPAPGLEDYLPAPRATGPCSPRLKRTPTRRRGAHPAARSPS